MKSILRFAFILLLLPTLAISCGTHTNIHTRKDKPLEFKATMCAIGPNGGYPVYQTYEVSDGTLLYTGYEAYKTAELAWKEMEKRKSEVKRTVHREDILDKGGKVIGERITGIALSAGGKESAVYLSLEEKKLYTVGAASLRHLHEFQNPKHSQ